jgi:transcriptional regulator with XRE-family HTH domain
MYARKGQVRDLLRAARARIDPTEVGLGHASRRKSPGLRREDVAVLAGVSLKWYTWLEQGRDLNFSEDVLDRVARTLRLSSCERSYLIALMQRRSAPRMVDEDHVTESLWRTVQFAPVPALAMTLRWDIVAWNHLTARVFRDYGAIPQAERNLLRIVLTDEKYQSDPDVYEDIARKLLGEFRVDFGQCAGDPAFEALIDELHAIAPGFESRWNNVELWSSQRGSLVQHDELGDLSFDRVSYVPEHSPSLRILMFIPGEPNTARVIASVRPQVPAMPRVINFKEASERHVLRHTNRH